MAAIKLVVSELLAYVQDQVDLMEDDAILQTCLLNYSEDEIRRARMLMYEALEIADYRTERIRFESARRSLLDIIRVLKETNDNSVPTFVAKELRRLPPAYVYHIDALKLCKDVITLKQTVIEMHMEMLSMHETMAMQTPAKKQHISAPKADSPADSAAPSRNSSTTYNETTAVKTSSNETKEQATQTEGEASPKQITDKTNNNGQVEAKADQGGEKEAEEEVMPKSVEKTIPYYLSRVNIHYKPQKIQNFLKKKTGQEIKVDKLASRNKVSFSSFVVWVPANLEEQLTNNFWPEEYTFRRFQGRIRKTKLESEQKEKSRDE